MALARAGSARAVLCWLGAAAFVLYKSVVVVFFTRSAGCSCSMWRCSAWRRGRRAPCSGGPTSPGWAGGSPRRRRCGGCGQRLSHRRSEHGALAEQDRARADQRPTGGVPARDRPAHQRGVRAGPGAVAAADRGGRGVAVAAPPLGAHPVIGATLVMWVLESTAIAVDQWFGHAADPASSVASGAVTPGLRGARADRADTRLLPVPQPPGQTPRTPQPPITSRWLSTAGVGTRPGRRARQPRRTTTVLTPRAAPRCRSPSGPRAISWSPRRRGRQSRAELQRRTQHQPAGTPRPASSGTHRGNTRSQRVNQRQRQHRPGQQEPGLEQQHRPARPQQAAAESHRDLGQEADQCA